jgi:putative membrane protein
MNFLAAFLLRWALTTLPLWVASYLFPVSFETTGALLVSGLLLGLVNAFVRPVLVFLTFPLSIVTLGFFILVINALMLLLVAWLVPGFHVGGFWTGFFVALFVSIFSFLVNRFVPRMA